MKIYVEPEHKYGIVLYYPKCTVSETFIEFLGKDKNGVNKCKVLREYHIELLKRIGYEIEWTKRGR